MMACVAIMGVAISNVDRCLDIHSLLAGNHGGVIGDFRWFGLNGVGMEPGPYADTIPHLVYLRVSDDVRHHHTGAVYRSAGGTYEI